MNKSRRLGLAGFLAGVLAFSGQANAACINTATNTVDTPGDCLFAAGGALKNCSVAISIDTDGAGTKPIDPKKIVCNDGDACDADGVINGSCTFRVGACVNIPNGACVADTISTGAITKPSDKEASDAIKTPLSWENRRVLSEALTALLPSSTDTCTDADLPVKVALKSTGGKCEDGKTSCKTDIDCTASPTDHCNPTMKTNSVNFAVSVTGSDLKPVSSKFKLTCSPALPAALTAAARAFTVSNPSDLIGGPLAMGTVGDTMIRNNNIRAVIRKPGRQHSFTLLNGGQIIDADLVRANPADDRDSWQGIQPLVNISSTQATNLVSVEHDGADGRTAVVHSEGPDDLFDVIKPDVLVLGSPSVSVPKSAVDKDLPITLATDFMLDPYSNVIEMATTVTNQSAGTLKYFMGDYVNPGGQLEPFGPGQGYGETTIRNGGTVGSGGQTLDYLAFQGGLDAAGVTYGVVFPGTAPATSTLKTGAFASSGVYAWVNNIDLFALLLALPGNAGKQNGGFIVDPNGTNTLRRWFVVGTTVADVTKARTLLFQQDTSAVQGVVKVGGVPVAGAHVTLLDDRVNYAGACSAPTNCVDVFSSTLTDAHGFYRFVVPPGSYRVAARNIGTPYEASNAAPPENPVTLAKKKTVIQNIDLPGTATVTVNAKDQAGTPIAAKVSIVGLDAAPDPLNTEYASNAPLLHSINYIGRYFGYNFEDKGDVFGLVDARFTDNNTGSTGVFNLAPGDYHVVVSHGYEYDVYDQVIHLNPGDSTTVNATVNDVVDTTGFVSIDTHVHMINSPDSTISRKRRILSMIAEDVNFFVNTDHDFVHSLTDEIADMGATSQVANAPSVETTTSHYGHFNTWPMTVDPLQVAGGATDWSFHVGDVNGKGYPDNSDATHAYDLLPGEIFDQFNPATQVIQINHFNSGTLGHFNMLGINTTDDPPTSSNEIYRCVGGDYDTYPCHIQICIGGANDGEGCSAGVDCPGGTCPAAGGTACSGGGTCTKGGNLGGYLRMDPAVSNLYSDHYTALEVWIEAGRAQTDLLRGDNMGDWFNLLNQGRFKAGTADSDTHSVISVQAGGPRTFVASSTDAPASIDANELAVNVNAMRAIGSNGPFMRVELENGSSAKASQALGVPRTVAFTGGGADKVNIHVEAPTWAQYDTIDVYVNSVPSCHSAWTFFGVINPTTCDTVVPTITKHKGADFSVTTAPGISGSGTRQMTDLSIPLTISADSWVVVVVRGTDGVSKPLFPMEPQDLDASAVGNDTLAGLTDGGTPPPWNLNEKGALALAYSNPLFFDDGDGECMNGTLCPGL